jgi:hypothetical protein
VKIGDEHPAIGDLAPTILTLLGVPVPAPYDGHVLKMAAPPPAGQPSAQANDGGQPSAKKEL